MQAFEFSIFINDIHVKYTDVQNLRFGWQNQ